LDPATLGHRLLGEVFFGGVFEPDPRMAQELPAQLVAVASVGRVREESLLQVGSQHLEEVSLRGNPEVREYAPFQLGYQGVLFLGGAVGEGHAIAQAGGEIQRRQAEPVGLGFIPVCARERPVQITQDAYPYRSRTVLIARKEAFEERRDRPCFVRGQNQQG